MATTILFMWTMVAAGSSGREYMDWRAIAEFTSLDHCKNAIQRMEIPVERVKCVAK